MQTRANAVKNGRVRMMVVMIGTVVGVIVFANMNRDDDETPLLQQMRRYRCSAGGAAAHDDRSSESLTRRVFRSLARVAQVVARHSHPDRRNLPLVCRSGSKRVSYGINPKP